VPAPELTTMAVRERIGRQKLDGLYRMTATGRSVAAVVLPRLHSKDRTANCQGKRLRPKPAAKAQKIARAAKPSWKPC